MSSAGDKLVRTTEVWAMWLSDPAGGVSQSMLVGLGVWVTFAYLWTFAPARGVARGDAIAALGLGGLGGVVGARVVWWVLQPFEAGADTGFTLVALLNPLSAGYSSLGFLGGAGVVVLGMSSRGFGGESGRGNLLDLVVPAGLLGLAFARLGCIFNGCDFGKVAEAGVFTVRYTRGSLAWQQHYARDLIGMTDSWSLPTYGFALFSAAATVAVVVWVSFWAQRSLGRERSAGSVALRAVMAFCVIQFFLEFLRESWPGGSVFAPYNFNQIALLGVFILVSCAGVYRARVATQKSNRDM